MPMVPVRSRRRSRGTPADRQSLLKRVRDFAESVPAPHHQSGGGRCLGAPRGRCPGFDKMDRTIMLPSSRSSSKKSGGPVGLDTLAAAVGEERNTIEDVYEPYSSRKDSWRERQGPGRDRESVRALRTAGTRSLGPNRGSSEVWQRPQSAKKRQK